MTAIDPATLAITLPVIEHFEASDNCHLDSYIVKGEEHLQATIGWGTAIPLSAHPMHITRETADKWLAEGIQRRYEIFVHKVPAAIAAKMTPGQKAAFLSWSYNGKGWDTAESFHKLCAGDLHGFADGADEWFHGERKGVILTGLVRRRAVERHLFDRNSLEEVRKLNWYRDLIPPGGKSLRPGHLAWSGTRLIWKCA